MSRWKTKKNKKNKGINQTVKILDQIGTAEAPCSQHSKV